MGIRGLLSCNLPEGEVSVERSRCGRAGLRSNVFSLVLGLGLAALVLLALPGIVFAGGNVWFVNEHATGANVGTSWGDAFTDLQSALTSAQSGDEIWVAAGTYRPTTTTDRSKSFTLVEGVALYGGFAGTETSRDQRDRTINVTTLSGDIGTLDNWQDNSYHVVIGATGATLDGFSVIRGYAYGSGTQAYGGAVYNSGASPTITNCTFTANWAYWYGGVIYNASSSSPTITHCTFADNGTSSVPLSNGGAIYNSSSSPTIADCLFVGNHSMYGGALAENQAATSLVNCVFAGNWATLGGGAVNLILGTSAPTTFTNCTFTGNSAQSGGAINNPGAGYPTTITNCIFWGDIATETIYKELDGSILDGDGWHPADAGGTIVNYSDVEGGYEGTGNVDVDPGFVVPYVDANTAFDLRPQSSSVVDAGTATGAPSADIRGISRPLGLGYDMGAYENASYTITVTATGPGTVDPSSSPVTVQYGDDRTFAFVPDKGYQALVSIDGGSGQLLSSYAFSNVTAAHSLSVTFERRPAMCGTWTRTPPGRYRHRLGRRLHRSAERFRRRL